MKFAAIPLIFLFILSACQTQIKEPSELSGKLNPFVEKHQLAGAVCMVADKDKIIFSDTVGCADIKQNKPMSEDAVFWIASQTKAMTATAVMILFDEGKIALDDPVDKYLPEFKDQMLFSGKENGKVILKKPSRTFTIREALSHTSGLPFSSRVERPTLDGLPLQTAVMSYALSPLNTEPGTHYQYSNAGINTAARIVEVVSGMKYEDFMDEKIFKPLGMKDTTFWPNEEQVSRLAKSYAPNKEKNNLVEITVGQLIYPLTNKKNRFPMPGGGLFSTAKDVSLFCRMLLNKGELNGVRIISEKAHKELTGRQTPKSLKESYGFGLSVGHDWYGHGGAFATNMEIRYEQELVFVWMVQHAGFPGEGGKAQGVFKNWALSKFSGK